MKIQNINDASFKKYGRILKGYPTDQILKEMQNTSLPDEVIYVASVDTLEATADAKIFEKRGFGGLEIEIGYCKGNNHTLNGLEYHRSSEINIAVTDLVLILGMQQDITGRYTYDTSKVEVFLVPKGTVIEIYATTLHYAPCNAKGKKGFCSVVILPKGTNEELTVMEEKQQKEGEDKLLIAKNKWLLVHKEAKVEGAFCGLIGESITIK